MTMGEQAGENCDDFGWTPYGPVDSSLVAEVTQHPRYGAGRAWSATSTYTLTHAPKRIYLVYTVEGGFDFTVDGIVESTAPGQLILLDGDAPTLAKTRLETARFVWHVDPTFLNPRTSRFAFHEPVTAGNSAMRALMSTTNAILNMSAPTIPAAQAHLGIAIEHLIAAALSESGTLPHANDAAHRDGLFTTAHLVIEAHFRDPGFGVAQLEKELSTGSTTLHSAFQVFGTTPRREIERRRVSEVTRLTAQVLTPAEVVERAGFTSIRQFRRAVMRHPGSEQINSTDAVSDRAL